MIHVVAVLATTLTFARGGRSLQVAKLAGLITSGAFATIRVIFAMPATAICNNLRNRLSLCRPIALGVGIRAARQTMESLIQCIPVSEIDALMPWNFKTNGTC